GGGGIYCEASTPTLFECELSDNTAYWAGGIELRDNSDADITFCTFSGNAATSPYGGGGLLCFDSSPTLDNCTFFQNSAPSMGAGIACWTVSAPVLNNCIIAFSDHGEAVGCDVDADPSLACCDLFGNAGGDWVGCLANQQNANDNIWMNPRFCDPGNRDLTLRLDSPCAPFSPPNNDCDLIGARPVACGAELYCGDYVWDFDSCEFCGYDAYFETGFTEMNHDCWVDLIDYILFVEAFQSPLYDPSGDYNGDGEVTAQDAFIFMQSYHQHGPVEPCETCGVVDAGFGGKIRVNFSADPNEDIDRIDIDPFVPTEGYAVVENCAGLAGITACIWATWNIAIDDIWYVMGLSLGDGSAVITSPLNGGAHSILEISFHTTDINPGYIWFDACGDHELGWIEYSQLRRMGFELINGGGVNGNAPPDSIAGPAAGIEDLPESLEPRAIICWPNPATGQFSLALGIESAEPATVAIYDAAGRIVRRLYDGPLLARQRLQWDGRADAGHLAPSGIYFVRVETPSLSRSTRLVMVK
ncbi:MAG: T9SS type A sorting domain-containing protein, partial [Candidatus Eisenbacteria bacterium]|nr:T9SS type A sorting domain-containing protein [Candidatus Eisenbacteria bacterium]